MTFNNSKSFLVILSTISVILFAILIMGVYRIRVMNKESSELLELSEHSAQTRILDQSIRVAQNMSAEDLSALELLTLSEDKTVSLIENIENVGRALGLETDIASIDEIKGSSFPEPKTIRIVVETGGSWTRTVSFLHAVESLPYRVMIRESDFSKIEVGPDGATTNWKSRIILELHSFD